MTEYMSGGRSACTRLVDGKNNRSAGVRCVDDVKADLTICLAARSSGWSRATLISEKSAVVGSTVLGLKNPKPNRNEVLRFEQFVGSK